MAYLERFSTNETNSIVKVKKNGTKRISKCIGYINSDVLK